MGASLLIFANKYDLPNCISLADIETVSQLFTLLTIRRCHYLRFKHILQRYLLVVLLLEKMYKKDFHGWFTILVISDIILTEDHDRSIISLREDHFVRGLVDITIGKKLSKNFSYFDISHIIMTDLEANPDLSPAQQNSEDTESRCVPQFLSKLRFCLKRKAEITSVSMNLEPQLGLIPQYLRDSVAIPEYLRQLACRQELHTLSDDDVKGLLRCDYIQHGFIDEFEVDAIVFRHESMVVRWNVQAEFGARNRSRVFGTVREPSLASVAEDQTVEPNDMTLAETGKDSTETSDSSVDEVSYQDTSCILFPDLSEGYMELPQLASETSYSVPELTESRSLTLAGPSPSSPSPSPSAPEPLPRSKRFSRLPLNTFYNVTLLHKIIAQQYLKQITELDCIPNIISAQPWLHSSPEVLNGIPGQPHPDSLSWVLEDCRTGTHLKLSRNSHGTDYIYYWDKNEWIRLRGRKKERFLDDLARIQVAYAMITSPYLGPLALQPCPDGIADLFPVTLLDDRFDPVTVDIAAPGSSPWDHIFTIPPNASTFLSHLVSVAIDRLNPLPGPYPLQPAADIWDNIMINQISGKITHVRNSWRAHTVPWEIAAQPPIKLSRKSKERFTYSLKRHWFGYLVRSRQDEREFPLKPRLDELVFQDEGIVECLLSMGEGLSDKEVELEERLAVLLFGKDWKKEKLIWESECNGQGCD
jgi:hypothetical protein